MKRLLALALTLWLALPSLALASSAEGAEEEFNPEHDFEVGEWIPIHLGPLDLSINKAVAYLMLATVVTITLGIVLMRIKVGSKNDPSASPGGRRDRLRDRADPGRRAGAAAQGDRGAGSRTSRR